MQTTNQNDIIPKFRPAKRILVCQDMAGQLQAAILCGKLEPGEKLPSENGLKRLFKTSRETVRQALRLLEERGFIEIREDSMREVYVRSWLQNRSIANLDLLNYCNQISFDQIADFRKMFESQIAAAAAKRADRTDIRRLFTLTERVGFHIAKGQKHIPNFIEADKQVHIELARITGNPLYTHIIEVTHGIKLYFSRFSEMDLASMIENVEDLRQISIAVSRHDTQRARERSWAHVHRFNQL